MDWETNTPRRDLASSLNITEKTLSGRIRRMKRSIEVETTDELVACARQTGAVQ